MASRFTLARVGAAVLGASAALMLSALPATAAGGPTTAHPDPSGDLYQGSVVLTGGREEPTTLIALKSSTGPEIFTYCVEIKVSEGGPTTTMVQVNWTDYPDQSAAFNTNKDKINWILHNSFPTLSAADLSKAAHTPTTLTKQQAVEGTQAAIWHESDSVNLDLNNPKNGANVKALYSYLVGNTATLPQPPANPTLAITSPSSTTGTAGSRIGPFVVDTNLQALSLTSQVPQGVTVVAVDANGASVSPTQITNGTKIYFRTSSGIAAGSGTFTLQGDAQAGQLFVSQDVADAAAKPGGVKQNCKHGGAHQSLIVAQSTSTTKSAGAKWTVATVPTTTTTPSTTTPSTTAGSVAAPTTTVPAVVNTSGSSPLPYTGVNIIAPVALAVVLIGAGGAFLLIQRRRKRA